MVFDVVLADKVRDVRGVVEGFVAMTIDRCVYKVFYIGFEG
jgi:hypothetical protein